MACSRWWSESREAGEREAPVGTTKPRLHQDRVPAGTLEVVAWSIVTALSIVQFQRPCQDALMNAWLIHSVPVVVTTG